MTKCRMHITTNTNSEYVILIVLSLQKWLRERASVSYYTSTAYLVLFKTHAEKHKYTVRAKRRVY
jgi:hypothetical protein